MDSVNTRYEPARATGPARAPQFQVQVATDPPSSQGKAFLAIAGAMIFPGVGHFIVGRPNRGLIWFAVAVALFLANFYALQNPVHLHALVVLFFLMLLVVLVQLFDAAHCGRHSPHALLGDPSFRLILGSMIAVFAIILHNRAIASLQDNVYELCYTPTPSMSPSVSPGDRYLTLKDLTIHRWDILGVKVAMRLGEPPTDLIKRVVGLPGEKVEITDAGLTINDKLVTLPPDVGPYFAVDAANRVLQGPDPDIAATGCWGRPITLGPDEFFLLGDNSRESADARFWPSVAGHQPGAIGADQITCSVAAICWPPSRWRLFAR